MDKITPTRAAVAAVVILTLFLIVAGVEAIPGKEVETMCCLEYIEALPEDNNAVDPADLIRLLNSGDTVYSLVDLRSPDEFQEGSLPGAINIFYKDLFNEKTEAYFANEEVVYILVDGDGTISFQLLPFFIVKGYKAKALTGGLDGYARMLTGDDSTSVPSGVFTPVEMPVAPPPPPAEDGGGATFEPGGCG